MSTQETKATTQRAPTAAAAQNPSPLIFSNRFLKALSPDEMARIFALSRGLAEALEQWAVRFPPIRRGRIRPLALSVAAAAPFCTLEALAATARVSLWVFALADLFDEESLPRQELMGRVETYRSLIGDPDGPFDSDSLAVALIDLRGELAAYPLFSSLDRQWMGALLGTTDSIVREYDWREGYGRFGPAMLPTYEEYLACGRYSIGGPPHVWSAMITTDDRSALRHLDYLYQMEELASMCIRLANDLRSHGQEVAAGKFNSLEILARSYHHNGIRPDKAQWLAEARVRADIADGLGRLARLAATPRTHTGRPEAAIANIARFVCESYGEHDFCTFDGDG